MYIEQSVDTDTQGGLRLTATLKRSGFGMRHFVPLVSDEIRIRIRIGCEAGEAGKDGFVCFPLQ